MYRLDDGIAFMKSLPSDSIDGIFTDPPWGKGPKIKGQDCWLDLIKAMDEEAIRIMKPGARALIWMGLRMISDVLKTITCMRYVWSVFVYYIPPRYIASFESSIDPILIFQRPNDKLIMRKPIIRTIYQKASTGKKDTLHPCARPFFTVKNILRDFFDENEYVIDPFAGSDTTGVACRELNLKYDSCEIDPAIYTMGQKRHAELLPGLFKE